jgi:hypothetical protein
MPALTLNQISSMLGSYIEPDGDFKSSLNQVLARIYNIGTYRDLTIQYSLPVVDGCITLPDEADAVLHVLVDSQPLPVRSLWHDFKTVGTSLASADMSWGLIDAGYHATKVLLPAPTDVLYVQASAESYGGGYDGSDVEYYAIQIIGTDGDLTFTNQTNGPLGANGYPLSFDGNLINHVSSIRYDGLKEKYDIVYIGPDNSSLVIATVGPDSGVTRYRRLRLNRSTDNETVVHVLCKRAFIPLQKDNDICYIGNIGAMKHGLLGRLAEDSADMERAEYHWQRCMLLLEEEAASSRGAAVPRLNIDPYGTGNLNRIVQLL